MRLDYKVDRPPDLAKLIAAFANTHGGLILMGVEADKTTNQPIWPPLKGMPTKVGIEEAITSTAQDAVYPPVRVEISPVIDNAHVPGHVLLVVRVDESREAPHAVDDGRKVYERTGSASKPYDLSRIDRIRYLLERRERIEQQREAIHRDAFSRATRIMADAPLPIAWASVIPLFPWRDLCRPSACFDFLTRRANQERSTWSPRREVQRIPGGAFALRLDSFPDHRVRTTESTTLLANGNILVMRTILSLVRQHGYLSLLPYEVTNKQFNFPSLWDRIALMFAEARQFLERPDVELPGLLSVTLGMRSVSGYSFKQGGAKGDSKPFLDEDYRSEVIVPAEEFLKPDGGIGLLRDRLTYAFDLDTPEGQ
jgi:hypothetical protein